MELATRHYMPNNGEIRNQVRNRDMKTRIQTHSGKLNIPEPVVIHKNLKPNISGLILTTQNSELISYVEYVQTNFDSFFVNQIDVANQFERNGYGTLSYLILKDIISKKRGRKIRGRIETSNERSIRFHEKFGFNIKYPSCYEGGYCHAMYKF